jgi:dihydrofolate reductase
MSIPPDVVRVRGEEHMSAQIQEDFHVRVVVFMSVTLDGVIQAPARPDEDVRGGFEHGGWAVPYADEVMGKVAGEGMAKPGSLLLGRRTYEDFFTVWPNRTDNPYTEVLNNRTKYVASRTLQEPLPWKNSTLLKGDAAEAVASLKKEPGGDLMVIGSGELVQSLMRSNLIDEYILLITPLVLGSGRRLFTEGGPSSTLRLVDTKTTTTGVVIATYQPVGESKQ